MAILCPAAWSALALSLAMRIGSMTHLSIDTRRLFFMAKNYTLL
jgi:hypothetical protein